VRELEHALGCALLKPAGRGLALTEAGQATMRQADVIFQLGEELPELARAAASAPSVRLAVGIPDGIPKLAVRRLLEPVAHEPHLRLLCHDGELEDLLGELALHKLDIVISDRSPPPNASLKVYSHPLVSSAVALYGTEELAARMGTGKRKTAPTLEELARAKLPYLLPTTHNVLRERIDRWFERNGITPRVVGEFEDSALLNTFGASGMGVFPAAAIVEEDLTTRYGVRRLVLCEGVNEAFFAITPQKKLEHRLVGRIVAEGHAGTSLGTTAPQRTRSRKR
jgi:LysR family transcriptional activator of nhaA